MRTSKLQILFVIVLATLSCKTLEGQILPNGATVELLATGFNFTEGPVYDGEGSLYFANLYFSATPSQIVRYDDSTGTTEVAVADSGMANGLFFDQEGQLISMDMGAGHVSRRAANDINLLSRNWEGDSMDGLLTAPLCDVCTGGAFSIGQQTSRFLQRRITGDCFRPHRHHF